MTISPHRFKVLLWLAHLARRDGFATLADAYEGTAARVYSEYRNQQNF